MISQETLKDLWHNIECIRDAAEQGGEICKGIMEEATISEQHKAQMLLMMLDNVSKQLHAYEPYISDLEERVAEPIRRIA